MTDQLRKGFAVVLSAAWLGVTIWAIWNGEPDDLLRWYWTLSLWFFVLVPVWAWAVSDD